MQVSATFTATLTGEAAALVRRHQDHIAHLPATIRVFILVELQKWPTLFEPEQRYQRTLIEHLAGMSTGELRQAAAGIARVESEAGIDQTIGGEPGRFQDDAQALLRRKKLLYPWRKEVDTFFQEINSALESRLYPANAPPRLVVQIYGNDIAVDRNTLWSRFKGMGVRVPLQLDGAERSDAFLGTLFGPPGAPAGEPGLFAALRSASNDRGPLDAWVVESHHALHSLWGGGTARTVTGLSYELLRQYREQLMRALYGKVLSGVESPQAFAAYARSLQVAPGTTALLHDAESVQAFVRDVFLTGNGTLFVNNTFVEWAAVQALRRAQPRVLVTRFGVRHKFRPFSSMLLFSSGASEPGALVEDPAGSFVDVEQLCYQVWLSAEKGAAYRRHTLYLFLAEGVDEMLAIRSDRPATTMTPVPARARLVDVYATMGQWLGVLPPDVAGTPIPALSVP